MRTCAGLLLDTPPMESGEPPLLISESILAQADSWVGDAPPRKSGAADFRPPAFSSSHLQGACTLCSSCRGFLLLLGIASHFKSV